MSSRSLALYRRCLGGTRVSPALQAPSRAFSTTLPQFKNGPLAVFPATSSPELDELLLEWRNKIFIPAHLGRTHKRMVRSPEYKRMLEGEDPYYIDIENTLGESESIQLQSVQKTTEEPKTSRALMALMSLLQEKDDWKILPEFWRELTTSNRSVHRKELEKFIRLAAIAGQLPLMIDIFKKVDTIGVKAGAPGTCLKLLNGAMYHSMNQEWQPKALKQSITLAEATLKLMHDPRHVTGRVNVAANQPNLYGNVMLLYAARAFLHKQTVEQGLESTAPSAVDEPVSLDFEPTPRATEAETAETAPTEPAAAEPVREISAGEKYGNAEADILRVQDLAAAVLDLSPNAEDLVTDDRPLVCEQSLNAWLPTWAAMQLVGKVLKRDDPIARRIQNAFNGDLGPLVKQWREVAGQEKSAENSRVLSWAVNLENLIDGNVSPVARVMM